MYMILILQHLTIAVNLSYLNTTYLELLFQFLFPWLLDPSVMYRVGNDLNYVAMDHKQSICWLIGFSEIYNMCKLGGCNWHQPTQHLTLAIRDWEFQSIVYWLNHLNLSNASHLHVKVYIYVYTSKHMLLHACLENALIWKHTWWCWWMVLHIISNSVLLTTWWHNILGYMDILELMDEILMFYQDTNGG